MSKRYRTIQVNVKKVDQRVERRTFAAIEEVSHLTPASEAVMENLITPGSAVVPTDAEIIARNTPGYVDPTAVVWEPSSAEEIVDAPATDLLEMAEPTDAALKRIEREKNETRADR